MNFINKYLTYRVGTRGNGLRRIYIQNFSDLSQSSFCADARYTVSISNSGIVLNLCENGEKKVLAAKKGNFIVELSNQDISSYLGDCESVTVNYKPKQIIITIPNVELRKTLRESLFMSNLSKSTITNGSLFSGPGILSYQIHTAFKELGIRPRTLLALELDELASRINMTSNPIWDNAEQSSVFIQDDINHVDMSLFPDGINMLEVALPCNGLSQLTPKDKKGMLHPMTGKLFLKTLEAITKINPATVVIECTPALKDDLTLSCIADYLSKQNYEFEFTTLKGSDFGDFEHRQRFCLFAASKGISHLFPSLSGISSLHKENKQCFYDIKEDIKLDSKVWKEYNHVKKRNSMDEVGYRNVLINDKSNHFPALVGGYNRPKAGAPFVQHPTLPNLQRLISVYEHCNIRKLPETMKRTIIQLAKGELKGQSRTNVTRAHEILGLSVSPTPWRSLITYMFRPLLKLGVNTPPFSA